MRHLGVFALIVSFLGQTSVPVAAGPLLESTKRAVQQLAPIHAESPNATAARRVVTDLGVGQHVAVKLTSGKTVRGHVQTISADHVVLRLDREAGLMDIAYGEVQRLGPNPSQGVKLGIGVGVVAAAVAVGLAVKHAQRFDIDGRHKGYNGIGEPWD